MYIMLWIPEWISRNCWQSCFHTHVVLKDLIVIFGGQTEWQQHSQQSNRGLSPLFCVSLEWFRARLMSFRLDRRLCHFKWLCKGILLIPKGMLHKINIICHIFLKFEIKLRQFQNKYKSTLQTKSNISYKPKSISYKQNSCNLFDILSPYKEKLAYV